MTPRPPHTKTVGAAQGGAIGIIVIALLQARHVHLTPELNAAITAIAGALGAAVRKPRPHPARPPAHHDLPPAPPSPQLTMYDAIDVAQLPDRAKAVAGYVGGQWPTYVRLRARFPNAWRLSIAVSAAHDAHCLDVEAGDATPEQVPEWVRRQHDRGVRRPAVYASVSTMPRVLGLLAQAGIKRRQIRVWTAHYTYVPHLCSPRCGYGLGTDADATQWTDRALGRDLDASLVARGFFRR